jgi:hypothetical protein
VTAPRVEFPHFEHGPTEFAPRYFHRDGTPATEAEAEAAWDDRGVAWSIVTTKGRTPAIVSTIFLGLDHAFPPATGPILFETAVFDGSGLVFRVRSRSESAARQAHASALIDLVAAIETSTPDDPFPTSPVESAPSAYLAEDPTNEGTNDDGHPDGADGDG